MVVRHRQRAGSNQMKRFHRMRERWGRRRHRAGVDSVGTILFAISMGATVDEAEAVAARRYPGGQGGRDDGAFAEGQDQRWFEEGQRDAADGSYRGHLYRKRSYDFGWRDLVEARAEKGWTNAQLTEVARQHAWMVESEPVAPVDQGEGSSEKTSVELFAEIDALNELRRRTPA
jgi:hypothetical protein